MKKVYFKPVMIDIELDTEELIAASAPGYEYRDLGQDKSEEDGNSTSQWGNLWNR